MYENSSQLVYSLYSCTVFEQQNQVALLSTVGLYILSMILFKHYMCIHIMHCNVLVHGQ